MKSAESVSTETVYIHTSSLVNKKVIDIDKKIVAKI